MFNTCFRDNRIKKTKNFSKDKAYLESKTNQLNQVGIERILQVVNRDCFFFSQTVETIIKTDNTQAHRVSRNKFPKINIIQITYIWS